MKEGFPTLNSTRWPNIWHPALDRWAWQEFISHKLASQPHTMQDHSGPVLRHSEPQGLWEADLVLTGGWGDPWFPWEDVTGLFEHFCGLLGRWKPLGWGLGGVYLARLTGELVVCGAFSSGWGPIRGEQGNSQRGLWRSLRLRVVEAAHGILGFTITGWEFQLMWGKHVQRG